MIYSTLKTILVATLLSASAIAQVPPGHGVRFTMGSTAPGIEIIDLDSGQKVNVSGLPGYFDQFNAGIIDPTTGDLYAIGNDDVGTGNYLVHIELNGTAVASIRDVADTGSTYSLSSAVFDRDGNLFLHDMYEIWMLERSTGALIPWDTAQAGNGSFNSLTIDQEGQKMWAVTCNTTGIQGSTILEYDLTAGPAVGTVLMDWMGAGLPPCQTGVANDGNGMLFISTFETSGNPHTLFYYDTLTGNTGPIPAGPSHSLNDVWYDRRNGNLHMIGAIDNSSWKTLDVFTGNLNTVNNGWGLFGPTTTNIAVNDVLHQTSMFPHSVSSSAGFRVNASAHGNPGDDAAILMTSLAGFPLQPPTILAMGNCDSGGYFGMESVKAPNTIPVGMTAGITAVVRDAATGTLIYGAEEELIVLP